MSEGPIATAYVEIKPTSTSIRAFPKTVKNELDKSLSKQTFQIKLTPVLGTYRKRIGDELRTFTPKIALEPVLRADFRTKLEKAISNKTEGIVVPINVVPVVGKVGKGQIAQLGLAQAGFTEADIRKIETALQGTGGTGTGRRKPRGGGKAISDQSTMRIVEERIALEKSLQRAISETTTIEDRYAAATKVVASAESELQKMQAKSAAAAELKNKGLVKLLEKEIPLVQAIHQEAVALETSTKADINRAAASEAVATSETNRLALTKKLTGLEAQYATIAETTTGKVAIAKARLRVVTDLQTKAEAQAKAAVAAGDAALNRRWSVLQRAINQEVRYQQELVKRSVAERKAGQASAARAAKVEQFGRGGGATFLSRLGARGATLAAGGEFLAGAAIITALGKAVEGAASLEQELNVFRITAKATAADMVLVSDKATQLGKDVTLPAVNANDAAEAMTELSKAGLSVQDSMDAARGTLQLATAAQLDNATAVNITASALNAFGLAGNQAVHVADLLAGAANEAQGGIGDMGASLSSVASVARQAGISLEDTIALLTLLAKNGIQGAEAGTALRVAIIRLIAPTSKAKEQLKELGIQTLDAAGNLRPEVFNDIAQATEKMGAAQRNAALNVIYGTRAIRAQAVIGREGLAGLNGMRDATNQAGLAAELAAARTAGFSGKIEAFKNSAATLGLTIGDALIPALTGVIDTATEIVSAFQDATEAVKDFDKAMNELDFGPINIEGISAGILDPLLTTGGEMISQARAAVDIFTRPIRGLRLPPAFTDPAGGLEKINEDIAKSTANASEFATALKKASQETVIRPETYRRINGELEKMAGGGKKVAAGYEGAAKYVQSLLDNLYGSSEETQKTRDYLEGVLRLMAALGREPTAIELEAFIDKGFLPDELADIQTKLDGFPPVEVSAKIRPQPLSIPEVKAGATTSAEKFAIAFGDALPDLLHEFITGDIFDLSDEAREGAKKTAASFSEQLAADLALALLTPSVSDELAIWRKRLRTRERTLTKAEAARDRNPSPENVAWVERAAGLVKEAEDEIADILKGQEQERKARADEIAKARNEADQAFLDALDFGRGRRENAILRAEGTAGLADDIKTQTALRDYLVKKRDEAAKTLKDAKTRAEAVQSLTRDIIQINQTIADLNRQLVDSLSDRFQVRIDIASIAGTAKQIKALYNAWLKELQEAYDKAKKGSQVARNLKLQILQTQQDAFDAINESFELDIQIAVASENKKKEIRARERFIEQLIREQNQYKRGTLEWKRLQLQIIEQKQAVKEARQAERDLFREMSFEFLTRQQGFAATVMSNLLGPVVLHGSVGGTTSPTVGRTPSPSVASTIKGAEGFGGGLAEALIQQRRGTGAAGGAGAPKSQLSMMAAENAAGARGGTPAQFMTIIHLLQQMVRLLGGAEARSKHPENKKSASAGGSAMDTM